MGLAVIPTDWNAGYIELCVQWPDSPEWLAILRGQLTDPGYDYFWDTFTGDPEDAKPAIFPTFNQNLHMEECMIIPTGIVCQWYSDNIPSGWLLFNGQLVSKTTYAALYAVFGSLWGETETEFNLGPGPGRVAVGYEEGSGDFEPLGETGGIARYELQEAEMPVHTHTQDSHTHTQNSHTHTQNAHTHTQNAHNHLAFVDLDGSNGGAEYIPNGTGPGFFPTQNTTAINQNTTATNQNATATNQNATATNQNAGAGDAHYNLQPYVVCHFIIKV